MQTGVEGFLKGLRDLSYEPIVLNGKADHVVISYEVQSGKFAGKTYKHGFIVPASWPVNPPGGIHVGAMIHPFQSHGSHPTGGIHQQQAEGFRQVLGGDWQYWSRPPADWNANRKTVTTYMSHVRRLWDTQ